MFNQAEIQMIVDTVAFPISKDDLLKLLYDNDFSTDMCNAISSVSYKNFNNFSDVKYAIDHYNPII